MKKLPLRLVQCKICDKLFTVPKRSGAVRYCSDECRKAGEKLSKRKYEKLYPKKSIFDFLKQHYPDILEEYRKVYREIRKCPICGKLFIKEYGKSQKYCSDQCRIKGYKLKRIQYERRRKKWLRMAGSQEKYLGGIPVSVRKWRERIWENTNFAE